MNLIFQKEVKILFLTLLPLLAWKIIFDSKTVKSSLGLDYLGDLESSILYNTKALEKKWAGDSDVLTDIYKVEALQELYILGNRLKKIKNFLIIHTI